MRPLAAPLALLLLLTPVAAQETPPAPDPAPTDEVEEGFSLLGEGAKLLFRGLMDRMEPAMRDMGEAVGELQPALRQLLALVDDLKNYQAPERLPNGDILIRRRPDAPPPPEAAPAPDAPADGVEL